MSEITLKPNAYWTTVPSGLTLPTHTLPLSMIPTMGASTSGAAGTAGKVPAASAGQNLQALRGDATFANDLEIDRVTDASGNRIAQFSAPGTSASTDSYTVIRSAQKGSGRNRMVAVGFTKTAQGTIRVDKALVAAGTILVDKPLTAAGTILVDNAAGYAPGPPAVTTIHIDGATTAPAVGDWFKKSTGSTNYQVTAVANVSGTDADITFTPELADTLADNDALTFLTGGYVAGVSTIHIDGASTAPAVGDWFRKTGGFADYQVTAVANVSGTDVDVTFRPVFADALTDNDSLDFFSGGYYQATTIHVDGVTTEPDTSDTFRVQSSSQNHAVSSTANLSGTDLDVTFTPALQFGVKDNEVLFWNSDDSTDFSLEPQNATGRVASFGDPLLQSIKPPRMIVAKAFGTTFDTFGLNTPTIETPGGAAVALEDTDGNYISLTSDGTTPLPCGLYVASATRRRHDPDYLMIWRSAYNQSRFWFGLFTGDPQGSDSLGSIKGVGIRYSPDASASNDDFYQFVISDGSTQTTINTAQAPTADEIQGARIRHLGSGLWEVSFYNFSTKVWNNSVQCAASGPLTTDTLGVYARLSRVAGTTNRKLSIRCIVGYQE